MNDRAPDRIWVEWPYANKTYSAFTDPPEDEHDEAQTGYIRQDVYAAALADAQATIARLEDGLHTALVQNVDNIATANARIRSLEAALRIARGHVAHSIEEWGVDDETSASMKEDLRVIESALSPREGEG